MWPMSRGLDAVADRGSPMPYDQGHQSWEQQGYAPVYPEAPQHYTPAPRVPGSVPPLWLIGGKDEPAHGPYQAPWPGGAPAPAHKVSPALMQNILFQALGRADMPVGLALRRRYDISYIIIGIPLWFNIYNDYMLLTDQHLVLSRRTLWSGIRKSETFAIPFDGIDYLTLSRGSWRKLPRLGIVQTDGGDVEVQIDKKAAGILAWYFSAPYG